MPETVKFSNDLMKEPGEKGCHSCVMQLFATLPRTQ